MLGAEFCKGETELQGLGHVGYHRAGPGAGTGTARGRNGGGGEGPGSFGRGKGGVLLVVLLVVKVVKLDD